MTNDSQLLEPLRLPLPDFRDWWSGHGVCFICPNVLLSRRRQRQRLQNFPQNFRPKVFKCVCVTSLRSPFSGTIILQLFSAAHPPVSLEATKKKEGSGMRAYDSFRIRTSEQRRMACSFNLWYFHISCDISFRTRRRLLSWGGEHCGPLLCLFGVRNGNLCRPFFPVTTSREGGNRDSGI